MPRGRVGGGEAWRKGTHGDMWPFVLVKDVTRYECPGSADAGKVGCFCPT